MTVPKGVYKRTAKHIAVAKKNLAKYAHPPRVEPEATEPVAEPMPHGPVTDGLADVIEEGVAAARAEAQKEVAAESVAVTEQVASSKDTTDALAFAMNNFADFLAKTPPGTAAKCNLGQAWAAVAEHYLPNVATHPLAGALFCTGQFAIVAVAVHGLRKQAKKDQPAPQQVAKANGVLKPGDNLFANVPSDADLADPAAA